MILINLLFSIAFSIIHKNYYMQSDTKDSSPLFFENFIDHFDSNNHSTYKQRYWGIFIIK